MTDLLAMFNELDDTTSQITTREGYVRAPFGYPGGKSRSVNEILPHLPYRNAYIEPFGGSGTILLARNQSPLEVYNDRYAGVVAFYRCLRDKEKMDKMLEWLEHTVHAREEFVWCLETWKDCNDDVERAARWWYMTVNSFASLGRNFGRMVKSKSRTVRTYKNKLDLFQPVHNRIKSVLFENMDWELILKDYDDHNAVFYLDPPYPHLVTSGGTYQKEMTEADHRRMLNRVFEMDAFVAVSSYDNPMYNEYPWDDKIEWESMVSIKGCAFTETNNLKGHEDTRREKTVETLYIKE